jgi:hypothetical protein
MDSHGRLLRKREIKFSCRSTELLSDKKAPIKSGGCLSHGLLTVFNLAMLFGHGFCLQLKVQYPERKRRSGLGISRLKFEGEIQNDLKS